MALGQNLWEFGTNPEEGATFLDRTVNNREFWISTGVDAAVSVVAGLAAAALVSLGVATFTTTAPLWLTAIAMAGAAFGIGVGLEALGVPQWAKNQINALLPDG